MLRSLLATFLVLGLLPFPVGIGAQDAAARKIVLVVEHMACPACGLTIQAALRKEAGVVGSRVDAKTETVSVDYDPRRTTPERIARAVTESGFPARVRDDAR